MYNAYVSAVRVLRGYEMRQIERWQTRLVLLRISTVAIIVTAILSVLIVLFTYYGTQVGQFIIAVEDGDTKALALCTDRSFEDSTVLLSAQGLTNATNITYRNIPSDIDSEIGGVKNDAQNRRYIGYTFYLKNRSIKTAASNGILDYTMEIEIINEFKDVSSAVRVMIIKNGESVIYAKVGADGKPEDHSNLPVGGYTTTPFLSNSIVCSVENIDMQVEEIHKYTVVVWLEGYDAQCVDSIKNGNIRMEMRFKMV